MHPLVLDDGSAEVDLTPATSAPSIAQRLVAVGADSFRHETRTARFGVDVSASEGEQPGPPASSLRPRLGSL
ncbi:hypothetical protein AWC15_13390 [Mycobacterium lacus]|uniref:Uncharacterized protein n=1 Tax=Mycobacterium lacus TaxID=169765 RepID=A0A1X1YTQ3_9MYCO|nr:hypothetical protein [Mycobacterium lacus]ORW14476.1 hypothetical protein AWC15_13390 [Mycobacterium lacus]BBX95397.1 hypothetical protein MLAC_06910 [Mycobacterium lacus]